jgi:hypothetical protein
MGSCIFWYVTPPSPVEIWQRFGGTYCLHLYGRSVSQASSKRGEEGGKRKLNYFWKVQINLTPASAGFIFRLWGWRWHFLAKCQPLFELRGVTMQKTVRLGPHERTKCVRCIACPDVRYRNRKKPIDLNVRGTRALLEGSHDVRWFSMDAFMLERTSSLAEWLHSFVYPRMVPARRALV